VVVVVVGGGGDDASTTHRRATHSRYVFFSYAFERYVDPPTKYDTMPPRPKRARGNDDDDDEEEEEEGFRLSKAPPLTADMIDALNAIEKRRVLARWAARMRSIKRRVADCSRQFPTSSPSRSRFVPPINSSSGTSSEDGARATSTRRTDD